MNHIPEAPAASAPKKIAKSPRRRAREFALQGLYQWRVGGNDEAAIEAHLADSDGFDKADREFFVGLLRGVLIQQGALQEQLQAYLVRPFEYGADAQIKEFLLVPYFGACIHAPPPPPNQTVFVMSEKPIKMKDLAQAVWIEGTIHTQTQESELADAAYTITLTAIEEYTY